MGSNPHRYPHLIREEPLREPRAGPTVEPMARMRTVPRKGNQASYVVDWRTGGARDGQTEQQTFRDEKTARKFKGDVEFYGHQYPPDYIKNYGYVDPRVLAEQKARLAAEQAAADAERDRPAALAFREDFKRWVAAIENIEPRTAADYLKQYDNHMDAFFGDLDPCDEKAIGYAEVKAWAKTIKDGVKDEKTGKWTREPRAAKTVRNLHALLSAYFGHLVDRDLRGTNPCAKTRLPESEEGEADIEMAFLEHAEFFLLLACAGPDVADLVKFLVGTALRFGEATALRVKDVYLKGERPYIMVRKAWKRQADNSYRLGRPKSKASRRRVGLSAALTAALAPLIAGRRPDDFVFTTASGAHWSHSNFFHGRWKWMVYRAVRCERHRGEDAVRGTHSLTMKHVVPCGCPGTLGKVPRIHDLRHTLVAWLLAANVPLYAVQKLLGHENHETTDKRYGHLLDEVEQRLAQAVDDVFAAAALAEALPDFVVPLEADESGALRVPVVGVAQERPRHHRPHPSAPVFVRHRRPADRAPR